MIVNQIVDDFEEWCSRMPVVAASTVREYLLRCQADLNAHVSVFVELAKIAMELSWMRWPNRFEDLDEDASAEALLEEFYALPRAADFLGILEQENVAKQDVETLLTSEYRLRTLFGDHPHLEMLRSAGVAPPTAIQPSRVTRVTSDFRNRELGGVVLYGYCEFGRRRSYESDTTHVYPTVRGCRVVVAPRNELRVSRQQFGLQLLCPGFAVVHNISRTNSFRIASRGIMKLGEKRLLRLPAVLEVPNQRLHFTALREK